MEDEADFKRFMVRETHAFVLKEGVELAESVVAKDGTILFPDGTALTQSMINQLVVWKQLRVKVRQYVTEIPDRDKESQAALVDEGAKSSHSAAIEALEKFLVGLAKGEAVDASLLVEAVQDIVIGVVINPNALMTMLRTKASHSVIATHSANVAIMSLLTAVQLGWSRNDLIDVGLGALLHDVGKLRIPRKVWENMDSPSADEMKLVRSHPALGMEMLKGVSGLRSTVPLIALQHHEHMDGSGYPLGEKVARIHPSAQLVGLANWYENAVRGGSGLHEAMQKLIAEVGRWYDSEIVKSFARQIGIYPVGSYVKLSSNEIARVTAPGAHAPLRPVIEIVIDRFGIRAPKPQIVDLATAKTLFILEEVKPEMHGFRK